MNIIRRKPKGQNELSKMEILRDENFSIIGTGLAITCSPAGFGSESQIPAKGQRIQSFANCIGLHRNAGSACHVPLIVMLFQHERVIRVAEAQPLDLTGVERRPDSAIAILAEKPCRQLRAAQENQSAAVKFCI